jgi:hypothetical protein
MLGRAGGVGLLALVAILWIALVTWSVSDPSLTHATGNEPRNLLGPLGAIISDLMLQTLGFAAVVILIAPLVWAIELIRAERLTSGRQRFGFFPLAALGLAGALASFPVIDNWPLHHGYGGALGDGLVGLVSRVFAVLNPDRADLAAGVLLNALAIAMSGKAVGIERVSVQAIIALFAARREAARHEPALGGYHTETQAPMATRRASWFAIWPSRLASRRARAGEASSVAPAHPYANPYGAAAALAVPQLQPMSDPSLRIWPPITRRQLCNPISRRLCPRPCIQLPPQKPKSIAALVLT